MVQKSLRVSQKTIKLLYEARALILGKDPQVKSTNDNILKIVLSNFKKNKGAVING